MVKVQLPKGFPGSFGQGGGIWRRKRDYEMMISFCRETTKCRRSPDKRMRGVGTNTDFKNLRYRGGVNQEVQEVKLTRLCRRVNEIS
jgi:hypothetical protein